MKVFMSKRRKLDVKIFWYKTQIRSLGEYIKYWERDIIKKGRWPHGGSCSLCFLGECDNCIIGLDSGFMCSGTPDSIYKGDSIKILKIEVENNNEERLRLAGKMVVYLKDLFGRKLNELKKLK